MADREHFPYQDDWRRDTSVLMQLGIMSTIARALVERHPSDADRIFGVLHCRTVWSEWDFSNEGNAFLNVQYKYPSVIYGENEHGHFLLDEGPLQTDDPETLAVLSDLADRRTMEVHHPFTDKIFIPAIPR